MPWKQALRAHWPEYLIEAWALGMFMLSAAVVASLLAASESPFSAALDGNAQKRVLGGLAMGLTAVLLIYSPWGQRSGAHMNPAVTLSYWYLGRMRSVDAIFYAVAQFSGAVIGVLLAAALLGAPFTDGPVRYAVTLPGSSGPAAAFAAELTISAVLMAAVLTVSAQPRWASRTGLVAGCLVALFIAVEEPLSGMSMNPARSFGSAAPAMQWQYFWIYCMAPPLGMLGAASLFRRRQQRASGCAKLVHGPSQRCIHCGYEAAR